MLHIWNTSTDSSSTTPWPGVSLDKVTTNELAYPQGTFVNDDNCPHASAMGPADEADECDTEDPRGRPTYDRSRQDR